MAGLVSGSNCTWGSEQPPRGPCPPQAGRCSCLVPAPEHRLQQALSSQVGNQRAGSTTRSHCCHFLSPSLRFALGWQTSAACLQLFFLGTSRTTAASLKM